MITEIGSPAPANKDVADLDLGGSSPSSEKTKPATNGGSPKAWCCLRRRGGGGADTFKQTFVVLRHSERKDYVDPTYKSSEEGLTWPHDAPLTEEGIKLAKQVADELYEVHQKANFFMIACSPYRRCLETAAEVARKLQLPVVIDQEIGEVRAREMPKECVAHRVKEEMQNLVKGLDMKIMNPATDEGHIKVFGKVPTWPETLEDAKDRYIVRMETYIRKGAEEKQNMIMVTHADAVVAALTMFERGGVDVQSMGFCARVIATRDVKESKKEAGDTKEGVFYDKWAVEPSRLGAEIFHEEDAQKSKIYEKQYKDQCEETQAKVVQRKKVRTKTDFLFDSTLKAAKTADDDEEAEEDEDEEEEKGENKV